MTPTEKDRADLEDSLSKFSWEPSDLELVDEDGNPITLEAHAPVEAEAAETDLTEANDRP